jgi:hypothetical protein
MYLRHGVPSNVQEAQELHDNAAKTTLLETQINNLSRECETSRGSIAILSNVNQNLGVMVSKLAIAFDQHTHINPSSESTVSSLVRDLQKCHRDVAELKQLNAYQQQIMASQKYLITLQMRQIEELRDMVQKSWQHNTIPEIYR